MPISNAFIYCVLVFIGCFPKPEDIEVTNKAIGYLFVAKNSTADVTIGLIADAVSFSPCFFKIEYLENHNRSCYFGYKFFY